MHVSAQQSAPGTGGPTRSACCWYRRIVEPDEQPQKSMVTFHGGPWEGHVMIMEGEPEPVIETQDDPPFRYRLSVKLGPVHPGKPERLISEPDRPGQKEHVTRFSDMLERDRKRR
jgi:hypothetical protein